MAISAGHSIAARIITSDELEINGGTVKLERGPAQIGYAVSDNQNVTGGPAQKVYVIEDADLKVNGGTFKLSRDGAVRVHSTPDRDILGGPAIPIYMVNGNIWNVEDEDDAGFIYVGDNPGVDTDTDFVIDVSGIPMTVDDLMIVSITYNKAITETISEPVGWTTIYEEHETGQGWLGLYWKLWEAGETTYTWTISLSGDIEGGVSVYNCVNADDPVNVTGPKNSGNSNAPKAKGVKPSKKNTSSIMFVGQSVDSLFTPPAGWIKRWQDVNASTADVVNTDGIVLDATGTLAGAEVWQAVMVAVNPCGVLEDNPVYFDYAVYAGNEQPVSNIVYQQGVIRFGYTPTTGNGSALA